MSGSSFDPLSEAEVSAIETELGIELPDAYRDFLTAIGAAAFDEIVRCSAGEVDYFYGKPTRSNAAFGLEWSIRSFQDVLPEDLIAIASDGGGNQLCLAVKGARRGSVLFWIHDALAGEDLRPVAGSFDELIDRLEVR